MQGEKRSDRSLQEMQTILDEMGRVARIGGWEMDLATGRATWTRSLYELVEVEFDPPPGVSEHLDYYPPQHRAVLAEAMRRLIEHGEPMDLELQGYTAKGTLKWWRALGRAVCQDGRCVKIRGVFQDIDDRKRAEQRLREHIRVLEILEQIDEVIRQASDLDQMLQRVLCHTRAAFEADRAWLFCPCDPDAETFRPPMACCLPPYDSPAARDREFPLTDAIREAFRWALDAQEPVTSGPGNERPFPKDWFPATEFSVKSRMVCAIRPTRGGPWLLGLHQCSGERVWTEDERRLLMRIGRRMADGLGRLLAERDREELIAKLESQNIELERFAYTVSHDLKSPLITITGYLGLLEDDALKGDREAVKDDAERIASAAGRMQRLLDELLELSRIGRLVRQPEEVSLGELAREATALLAGPIERAGARVEIAPDLPRVRADRRRLLEVYQNLIENAVKYAGEQSHPRIEVGVRADGDQTVLLVRDNGMGIEPRYHQRVFRLFDQLDPKSEGTGIGLAMAKRIVELHGGRIWVESEGPSRGSTFCFTLAEPQVPPATAPTITAD